MKKYVCRVCGYEYDPEEGDPESEIPAGVAYGDLPKTWICPVCGAPHKEFYPEE